MRLQERASEYTVVRSHPSWGFFFDKCTVATPEEIEIVGKGYVVWMYLMVNVDPKAFIGVRATDGEQYDIGGDRWVKLSPPSSFIGRATHWTRLSALRNAFVFRPDATSIIGIRDILSFRVANRKTGEVILHSYPFEVIQCTCVTYEGPIGVNLRAAQVSRTENK